MIAAIRIVAGLVAIAFWLCVILWPFYTSATVLGIVLVDGVILAILTCISRLARRRRTRQLEHDAVPRARVHRG